MTRELSHNVRPMYSSTRHIQPHIGSGCVFAVMLQNNVHPFLRDGAELAGYPFADSVFFVFHTLYL